MTDPDLIQLTMIISDYFSLSFRVAVLSRNRKNNLNSLADYQNYLDPNPSWVLLWKEFPRIADLITSVHYD